MQVIERKYEIHSSSAAQIISFKEINKASILKRLNRTCIKIYEMK